mgnify:CR=1 FL=1
MARPQSFGAKIANREKEGNTCAVCGEQISYVKHYANVKTENGSNKYKQKVVGICACNKKEYMG